jgi:hypothetical protein
MVRILGRLSLLPDDRPRSVRDGGEGGWRTTDATSLPASVSGLRKIEAGDDAHALAKSDELILESDFLAIEVWQRTRFVGRHTIAADIKIISGGRGAA